MGNLKYDISSKIIDGWTIKKTAKHYKKSERTIRKYLQDVLCELDAELQDLECDIDSITNALEK